MQQEKVQQKKVLVPTVVLVPIIKISAQSRTIGKEINKRIRAGDQPAAIGKDLASQIKQKTT